MKKITKILMVLLVLMLTVSCADTAHVEFTNPNDHIYGFWGGVWHGCIMIWSFIGSLFDDGISIYAVRNNGAWYDFGFVGGLGLAIKIIRVIIHIILNVLISLKR
jgi:hypothetical protein